MKNKHDNGKIVMLNEYLYANTKTGKVYTREEVYQAMENWRYIPRENKDNK